MMTTPNLLHVYYNWILKKVGGDSGGFDSLLSYLFSQEYHWSFAMDENRYEDGISLRYTFGYECGIPREEIQREIDICGCTYLEMLAALAIRTEVDTMSNSMYGDRTYIWFWSMIKSLGLAKFDDEHFPSDISKIDNILSKFERHEYAHNGKGGIVTLKNTTVDLRVEDIWTQMQWKLDEYLEEYGG